MTTEATSTEAVEKYIRDIPWTVATPDIWKSIVAGNIRAFARWQRDTPPAFSIGDIVAHESAKGLHCGSGIYPDAVVVSMEPFVMVSRQGDMLWMKMDPAKMHKTGAADAGTLWTCFSRFAKDRGLNQATPAPVPTTELAERLRQCGWCGSTGRVYSGSISTSDPIPQMDSKNSRACPACGHSREIADCLDRQAAELAAKDERIAALETKAHNMEQAAVANKNACDRMAEQRQKDAAEIERLSRACRTRDDYNIRCQDCGAPHNVDTSIPSPIWNAICENRPGILPGAAGIGMPEVGVLCTLCIDERLQKAGMRCDKAEFYYVGTSLESRLYAEDEKPQPLRCIFCSFAGDSLDELKQHSAECEGHPLMEQIRVIRDANAKGVERLFKDLSDADERVREIQQDRNLTMCAACGTNVENSTELRKHFLKCPGHPFAKERFATAPKGHVPAEPVIESQEQIAVREHRFPDGIVNDAKQVVSWSMSSVPGLTDAAFEAIMRIVTFLVTTVKTCPDCNADGYFPAMSGGAGLCGTCDGKRWTCTTNDPTGRSN